MDPKLLDIDTDKALHFHLIMSDAFEVGVTPGRNSWSNPRLGPSLRAPRAARMGGRAPGI